MFFNGKRIIYLNSYEAAQKGKPAGFARITQESGSCRLELHISRMRDWKDGTYRVIFEGMDEETELGTVRLWQGEGSTFWSMQINNEGLYHKGKEIQYEKVDWIRICGAEEKSIRGIMACDPAKIRKLQENKEEKAEWKKTEKPENEELMQQSENVVKPAEADHEWKSAAEQEEARTADRKKTGTSGQKEERTAEREEIVKGSEDAESSKTERSEGKMQEAESCRLSAKWEEKTKPEWLEGYAEDKWKQLGRLYSKVHPFGDEREFLTIEPKDFIILRAPYQKLVNNSFLLHGFYNYRHIILGICEEERMGSGYYLGVPGTFYEREKMVAVMFGFEGFECKGPVETGKFGYFMRRVEL